MLTFEFILGTCSETLCKCIHYLWRMVHIRRDGIATNSSSRMPLATFGLRVAVSVNLRAENYVHKECLKADDCSVYHCVNRMQDEQFQTHGRQPGGGIVRVSNCRP